MRSLTLPRLLLVLIAATPTFAAEKPTRDWTVDDFREHGHIVKAPPEDIHGEFHLHDWTGPTLLDLRGSTFFANEDGPYNDRNLPKPPETWPTGEAFTALPEASGPEKYPVSLKGQAQPVRVLGGRIIGVQPRSLPWRFLKHSYDGDAVRIEADGEMVLEGSYAENIEDVLSPRGTGYWIARSVHAVDVRDDFVENDGQLSGEIDDCLVEGCHVLLSARPGKKADAAKLAERAKHPPLVKITRTLCRVTMQPYDGDMHGEDTKHIVGGLCGGKLFKWHAASGKVDVSDCVFRLDGLSPQGGASMGFPEGTYRNVTLIWLGPGEYPAPLPPGVTVTRDTSIWDRARQAWIEQHPLVPQH